MNKPEAFSSPRSIKRFANLRRFYLATILILGSLFWLFATSPSSAAPSGAASAFLQRLIYPASSVNNIIHPSAEPVPVDSLATTVTALAPLPVSADTGEKPQSKIWYYGNTW